VSFYEPILVRPATSIGASYRPSVGHLMQTGHKGYRGYVFSRSVDSHRVPQHIQNLVIRDYAARCKLHYLLSATEYTMPDCYLILEQVLAELAALDGVILYTMFMLPSDSQYNAGNIP